MRFTNWNTSMCHWWDRRLEPKASDLHYGNFQGLVSSLYHPSTLLSQPETCKLAVCLGMTSLPVTCKRKKAEKSSRTEHVAWLPLTASRHTMWFTLLNMYPDWAGEGRSLSKERKSLTFSWSVEVWGDFRCLSCISEPFHGIIFPQKNITWENW